MQNKFYKIILIIAVAVIVLVSLIYFARTVIDIGCAKTGTQEGSPKRRFIGINCWSWERTFILQGNVNIDWK